MRPRPLPPATKQRCLALLAAGCSSAAHVYQIHALLETSGLLSYEAFVASELIRAFALSPFVGGGGAEHARRLLLTRLPCPSSASWNHVIRGYARGGGPRLRDSVEVFLEMRRRGGLSVRPNELTYPFVLNAAADLGDLDLGRQVHADAVKGGFGAVVYVGNTLLHLYGSCCKIAEARRVFDEMSVRTVVTWNTLLSVYTENSWFHESLKLFSSMRSTEFAPDETTFVILLSGAAKVGHLSLGFWVHSQIIGKGMAMNLQLGTALVGVYAKSGVIGFAHQLFERMPAKNVWTWSTMILGFAQHGSAREALELFSQMKKTTIKPNYVTFLGVLCACSHAGWVVDGYRFFHEMTCEHGIEPRMSHYSMMVDILGRSSLLEEAYGFIKSMPVEPDAVVWRTLLSACNIHNASNASNVGSAVRQRLLELEPRRSGNYVMVANMYAEIGLWDKAAKVRRVMREEGMKKMAGESCIQVGSSIMRFVSGDELGVGHESVYCLLDGLNLSMKLNSWVDTDWLAELFLE